MATNLSLDPKLIERAVEVSGERTKRIRNSFASVPRAGSGCGVLRIAEQHCWVQSLKFAAGSSARKRSYGK